MPLRIWKILVIAAGVVLLLGAVASAPPLHAQTRDRQARPRAFELFAPGSELGVSVRELTNDEVSRAGLDRPGGVYVQNVREGSAAARAGLRGADIIVTFDGERVRGVRHFSRLVLESPAGRAMRAEVVRDGSRQAIDVTPEASERLALPVPLPEIREQIERGLRRIPPDFDLELPVPPRAARVRLGLTLEPLTDQLASYFGVREGVLVASVAPGSPAAQAGIRAGDVITAIDGRPVRTQADVTARARGAEPGAPLEITLTRDKKEVTVKVTIPERQSGPDSIPI